MRPSGDRTRKDLDITTPKPESHAAAPTSFFFATEDMLDRANTKSVDPGSDSTFGVRSLQETICEIDTDSGNGEEEEDGDGEGDDGDDDEEEDDKNNKGKGKRRRSTLKPQVPTRDSSPENPEPVREPTEIGGSSRPRPDQQSPSYPSISHSVASLSQASPTQGSSLPSSPKSTSTRSLRHSDEDSMDERGSQAILSSEDDEIEHPPEIQGTAPQLIMPSIKMPSRRPFTERGKDIGRLKILIAGDSGVGKTSLIKSIVQTCEDIVHADPLSLNASTMDQPRRSKSKTNTTSANSTSHIAEVYASTKAYPPWWSEIEESRVLRRRKSMGDTVLERNLCFVDTPGYSHGVSASQSVESVVHYIESQLSKLFSLANEHEGELLSMLSGHGGTQVDVVFYMILQQIKPVDLDFLRRLSTFTNIIPLIAKADLLSIEEAEQVQSSIANDLESAGIRPFMFDPSRPVVSSIYTVCSAPSSDEDNMDASLLMSPDYIQPLLPSKLNELVGQIFEKDHISWLRHLAATKLVSTRREMEASVMTASVPNSSLDPLQARTLRSPTSPAATQTIVPYASGASSYVRTRVADHTQREEKLAQVRLAKWAGDLQRSLQNERARYEALSRGERAIWLTERLGECVNDGTLMPVQNSVTPSAKALSSLKVESSGSSGRSFADGGDPLGLLKWNEAMRGRGWIAFQVVGSFGVLGAMAVWMARSWGLGSDGYPGWNWVWWGW